jgi:hypothetical protein
MRNLLSSKYKYILRYEYWARLTGIFLLLASVIGMINILLLGPALWVMRAENSALVESVSSYDNSAGISREQTEQDIEVLSVEVARIGKYSAETKLSSYTALSSLLALLPDGISLHAITMEGSKKKAVTVYGVAQTREVLVAFVDALEESKNFEETTLPLPQFASREEINFSLALTGVLPE